MNYSDRQLSLLGSCDSLTMSECRRLIADLQESRQIIADVRALTTEARARSSQDWTITFPEIEFSQALRFPQTEDEQSGATYYCHDRSACGGGNHHCTGHIRQGVADGAVESTSGAA